MKHAEVAAYFARDSRRLRELGTPSWLVDVLELHWADRLAEAESKGRSLLDEGAGAGSHAWALLAAEVHLLSAKLGRGVPKQTKESFAPAALIREYADFLHFFYVDHRRAWLALLRLVVPSLRVRASRFLPTVLFLVGHMAVMAGWPRIGFFVANLMFQRIYARKTSGAPNSPPHVSESLPFACFPYTGFLAGRFDRLEDILERCRTRRPPDDFYLSIFTASALYSAAFMADVARTDIVASEFQRRFERAAMRRYQPVARIVGHLPLALRGYGHLVYADCREQVAEHDSQLWDAIVNSQFYRMAALVFLSVDDRPGARECIEQAIAFREKTKSFGAWKRLDFTIRDMADGKVAYDPTGIRLFGARLKFDSPPTLGMLLSETIGAMPLVFSGGMEAFEARAAELIRVHLNCKTARLEPVPASLNEHVAQMRLGSRYLILEGVENTRAPMVERFLSSLAPVFGIIEVNAREILRLKADSEHASRLAAIARTTQMLAHDVRRPFTILNSAVAALRGAKSPEDLRHVLDVTLPEVDRAAVAVRGLISDVIEVDNCAAPQREKLAPESLIAESLQELDQLHPTANVAVRCSLAHTVEVLVDRRRMLRVFANIFQNAVQAMNGVGEISIATESDESWVTFTIGNVGPTLSPEDAARVFEPFFTKNKAQGTGLGLAIVQHLITMHGGRIRCEPLENGVEFVFTLPAASGCEARDDAFERLRAQLPARIGRAEVVSVVSREESLSPSGRTQGVEQSESRPVLALVDDRRSTLLGWRYAVKERADVMYFRSPGEFLSAASDEVFLRRLAVVVTDYQFDEGGIDGAAFGVELRKRVPQVPVVLSSSGVFTVADLAGTVDVVIDKEPVAWEELQTLVARSSEIPLSRRPLRADGTP